MQAWNERAEEEIAEFQAHQAKLQANELKYASRFVHICLHAAAWARARVLGRDRTEIQGSCCLVVLLGARAP